MDLDALVSQLRQLHGPSLVAAVLYGSAAGDDHIAGHSDQNVLVIVDSLDISVLQALGQTARAWQEAGNPPPLMLTRQEWMGSADVFPLEYADILERHRVLAGTLPLDGIAVHPAHLRLQLEQEALGKLLRLRRATMTAAADVTRQREVLRASLSAMLVIFQSVLRLHGERPPQAAADVVSVMAARCGLAAQPFLTVLRLVRGETVPDGEIDGLLTVYLHGVEALTRYIDQYPVSDGAPGRDPS